MSLLPVQVYGLEIPPGQDVLTPARQEFDVPNAVVSFDKTLSRANTSLVLYSIALGPSLMIGRQFVLRCVLPRNLFSR